MHAERFLVSGRVQGVGFRTAARQRALGLELSGYARNLPDGCVEVVAQGDAIQVDEFANWLQLGPPLARVNDVRREPAAISRLCGFICS